jgi:Phage Mu protein F like protein
MADPLTRGMGPSPEVLAYFRNKNLVTSFDWRDVWQEEHAHAFTVAKAMQMDVLKTIHAAVEKAIVEGQPFEQFQAELTPRLIAAGWWGKQVVTDPASGMPVNAQLGSPHRLRIIFDANIRTANAAGFWERIQRSKDILPYLMYMETTSREARAEHLAWASQPVILPVDHPWWQTHFPPNGWQCKCWVLQIDEEDALAAGYTPETQAPELDAQPWENRRTGAVELVPSGIDPGWASNPGYTRQRLLEEYLAERLVEVDPALKDTVMKDLTSNQLFKRMTDGIAPAAPVSVAPAPALQAIGITKPGEAVVWLPKEVAKKVSVVDGVNVASDAFWQRLTRTIDEGVIIRTLRWLEDATLDAIQTIEGVTYRARIRLVDHRLLVEDFAVLPHDQASDLIAAARTSSRLLFSPKEQK